MKPFYTCHPSIFPGLEPRFGLEPHGHGEGSHPFEDPKRKRPKTVKQVRSVGEKKHAGAAMKPRIETKRGLVSWGLIKMEERE